MGVVVNGRSRGGAQGGCPFILDIKKYITNSGWKATRTDKTTPSQTHPPSSRSGSVTVNKPKEQLRWMVPVFRFFEYVNFWKERTKSQLNVITKFVYDSIAKLVLVQKRQVFCHQLLPWQRYLMIVQTYFWASKAHILKTNVVTPNFFHISFFVIWKWNYMII